MFHVQHVVSANIEIKSISKSILSSWNELYTHSLQQWLIPIYISSSSLYSSQVVARSINMVLSTATTTDTLEKNTIMTTDKEISVDSRINRRNSKQPAQVKSSLRTVS